MAASADARTCAQVRVIGLDDLGTRFSGEYYVTSVVHSFSRHEGYLTDFQVRRNAS